MTQDHYDVLIVGGGMVGATLACALGDTALRVAVVEGVSLQASQQPSFDARSIALAYGSRRIFEGMTLWRELADEVEPIRMIHVSDRGRFGATRLDCRQQGVDALGYVLETRVLGQVLQQKLSSLSNVDFLCPAQVTALTPEPDSVRTDVEMSGGERRLSASVVVAADGVESGVREQLQIPVTRWDYGQTAIIANVETGRHHGNVAYERFTDTGPLALLPLRRLPVDDNGARGASNCSLVWTVRHEQVESVMQLEESDFLARLQERFGFRLGRFARAGTRHAYPLSLVRAREHVHRRVALIGNAAHTLHPVAGQGFNLGIRDVAVLAQLLADADASGQDPGAAQVLDAYAHWRRADHRRVIAFTDGLARLFSNPLPPVAWLRDAGLVAVDVLPGLKRAFARQTMGLAGKLPRLARGLPLT